MTKFFYPDDVDVACHLFFFPSISRKRRIYEKGGTKNVYTHIHYCGCYC